LAAVEGAEPVVIAERHLRRLWLCDDRILMNVLLTSVGRWRQTVWAFRDALRGGGRVLACDFSGDAPALQEADAGFVVPRVDDERYINTLLGICEEHHVDLLIPALEIELPPLVMNRERFARIGTTPIVSSRKVIDTCFDKMETARFLRDCDLAVPHTHDSLDAARDALSRNDLTFPVVVKPRWGVSSIETEFPEDAEELELAYKLVRKRIARTFLAAVSATDPEHSVLIQEQLFGEEYGLDIVNDLSGQYVTTFTKRKLRMRAGQTDRAVTIHNESLERLGRRIGQSLRHIGNLDCDVFVTEAGNHVIDLNPRFGGGYPFSHVAGANLPAALIAWAQGEKPDPEWLKIEPGIVISRADDYVVIDRDRLHNGVPAESMAQQVASSPGIVT
jgi:carbamoyl-phosphate synthase large subunit